MWRRRMSERWKELGDEGRKVRVHDRRAAVSRTGSVVEEILEK
jgi:hypothetical protein